MDDPRSVVEMGNRGNVPGIPMWTEPAGTQESKPGAQAKGVGRRYSHRAHGFGGENQSSDRSRRIALGGCSEGKITKLECLEEEEPAWGGSGGSDREGGSGGDGGRGDRGGGGENEVMKVEVVEVEVVL